MLKFFLAVLEHQKHLFRLSQSLESFQVLNQTLSKEDNERDEKKKKKRNEDDDNEKNMKSSPLDEDWIVKMI